MLKAYFNLNQSFLFALVIGGLTISSCNSTKEEIIPLPFTIVVDDLGWMQGSDLNKGEMKGKGPSRLGINKSMNTSDYQYLVDIAQEAGVRLQGSFILGEWDRNKILSNYPTTNMHGAAWTNEENINDMQYQVVNYIKKQAAYIEFGFHGICHEYWPEPMHRRRAEWYNQKDREPWSQQILKGHLEAAQKILDQYGINKENGHDFPQSFVPPAMAYYWNPKGDYSLGAILNDAGIKYASIAFNIVNENNPPKGDNVGAFDQGVYVINRGLYGNDWDAYDKTPTVPIIKQERTILESHWPNFLAQDSTKQNDTKIKWVNFFKEVQRTPNRYVAKNTEQFVSQWLYNKHTNVNRLSETSIEINNSNMPGKLYDHDFLKNLMIKIAIKPGEHIKNVKFDGGTVCSYYESEGFAHVYLPMLERKAYTLDYELGESIMSPVIYNDGTYNIYNFSSTDSLTSIDIKLYGTQKVKIMGVNNCDTLISNSEKIRINQQHYNDETQTLTINLSAHNIQGERGSILVYHNN